MVNKAKFKINWSWVIVPLISLTVSGAISGLTGFGAFKVMQAKAAEIMPRKEIEVNFNSISKFIESVDDRLGNIERVLMIKATGK